MKSVQVASVLKEVKRIKFLSLKQLDAVLADDGAFEKNIQKLLACPEEAYGLEIPDTEIGTNGLPARPAKVKASMSSSAFSTQQGFYSHYSSEIRGRPRMSREEEYRFAKRMEFFRRRMIRLIRAMKFKPKQEKFFLNNLSCAGKADNQSLCPVCLELGHCPRGKDGPLQEACRAYNKCRSIFVEANLHLVVNLTRPYKSYGMPLMDLVQEGNAALIRAVEKFDWRKGVRLRTYADFWIRQAVERSITANRGIVRVPNHVQQKMRRCKRQGKLSINMNNLSIREVSEALDMSKDLARHLMETERGYISLDALTAGGDDNLSLEHLIIEEPVQPIPKDEIENLKFRLQEAVAGLTEQEQIIIKHRYGMGGAQLKTLDELGGMMNVSRERVRQIQNRTLQKLKRHGLKENLKAFL